MNEYLKHTVTKLSRFFAILIVTWFSLRFAIKELALVVRHCDAIGGITKFRESATAGYNTWCERDQEILFQGMPDSILFPALILSLTLTVMIWAVTEVYLIRRRKALAARLAS